MPTMARMQVTPLVGRSVIDTWADVYSFRLPDGCELVCVSSISGQNAHQAGQELFILLQSFRYVSPEHLYQTVTEIFQRLAHGEVTYSCAVLLKASKTYFCLTFRGAILVHRRGSWKTILPVQAQWNMVGGAAEEHDVLLLTTQTAYLAVQEALEKNEPFTIDSFAAHFASKLQSEARHAAACVQYPLESVKDAARFKSVTQFIITQPRWRFFVTLTVCMLLGVSMFLVLRSQRSSTSDSPTPISQQMPSQNSPAPQFLLPTQSLTDLPVVYDMRLAVPDFVATYAASVGSTVLAVDTQKQTAIVIQTTTKQVEVKVDPLFGQTRSVTGHPDKGFFILGQGINRIPLEEGVRIEQVKEEGDSNKDARVLAAYGPYVYVLNPTKRAVYRYAEQKETYSSPIGWLQDPLGLAYDDVVSLSVDGSVWVSSTTGIIKKFTSGKSDSFSLASCEPTLAHQLFLATREDSPDLFVLDPAEKRIVVVGKDGTCKKQIISPSLAAAHGITMGATDSTLYVISGSLLYEVKP